MIEQFVTAIWQGFSTITPAGVAAEFFWPTFILIFAMIYTLLGKVSIFGDIQTGNAKALYLLVSLIFAYFTASSAFATLIISKMTPQLGMVLVAVLVFLLIFAALSGEGDLSNQKWLMSLLLVIGVIWVFGQTILEVTGINLDPGGFGLTQSDMGIIVAFVVIIAVMYFVFRDS